VALVKIRNRGTLEKSQAVELGERIRDFFITAVDLAYPLHWPDFRNIWFEMVGPSRAKPRQPNDCRGGRIFDSVALWPPVANRLEFKRLGAIGIVGVAAAIAKCDLSRDGNHLSARSAAYAGCGVR
jgi:hypothetical protein